MSTKDAITLDADRIKELIGELSSEERQLFSTVIREAKELGGDISDATINELAKKYADKARQLAGEGSEK